MPGLATIVALYAKDPTQAALTFQAIEAITNGLGNANGEILGGPLTLLVSLAALRTGGLPKGLNILGVLVGAVGIITIIPALNALTVLSLAWVRSSGSSGWGSCCCAATQAGRRNTNSLFDFKFQQQTRVLERLTLNLSNFEK